ATRYSGMLGGGGRRNRPFLPPCPPAASAAGAAGRLGWGTSAPLRWACRRRGRGRGLRAGSGGRVAGGGGWGASGASRPGQPVRLVVKLGERRHLAVERAGGVVGEALGGLVEQGGQRRVRIGDRRGHVARVGGTPNLLPVGRRDAVGHGRVVVGFHGTALR